MMVASSDHWVLVKKAGHVSGWVTLGKVSDFCPKLWNVGGWGKES